MARSGRPITLPGFWGPLVALKGGLRPLLAELGTSERTLRHWAQNERGMDAIVAAKIEEMNLPPEFFKVYHHPAHGRGIYIGSAPEGWVMWASVPDGWARRTAFDHQPTHLIPADLEAARATGWPW